MIAIALLSLTVILAFANGGNDVSKGIATLVGAGVSNYRTAVIWGSVCTIVGAVAAAFASQRLIDTFSGKAISSTGSPSFLLAVAVGAIGWLLIATRTGLPVSTTHSLVGALVGAAFIHAGAQAIRWSDLARNVALPLLASPIMALLLLWIVLPLLRPLIARFERSCVCIEEAMVATPEGTALRETPVVVAGSVESCSTANVRYDVLDGLHWVSSGATSFFRALNDAPKILALAMTVDIAQLPLYLLVALAMGAGSLLAGFRVTRTLAERVTPITPANGFAANVVTSLLVGLASRFALPVSTTHVSSGAIIGVGIARGGKEVRWTTVGEMLLAWLVTLPASAAIAAIVASAI
jgi:PiT family inorganic phosphate transporter